MRNPVGKMVAFATIAFLVGFCGPQLSANEPTIEPGAPEPKILPPLFERFEPESGKGLVSEEVPDFQKHVSPLFGRLGCNGRACHGSFQGQGGFQLSLFGYDFKEDYQALFEEGAGRVDLQDKPESLILTKPVDEDMHDGGKRFEHGGWEYQVLKRWIDAGAPFERQVHKLRRLEVLPSELQFSKKGESTKLRAIAHWQDGTSEDVTCLCRFQTNDSATASIQDDGRVTAGEAGDTHVVISYDNAVVAIPVLRPATELLGDRYPEVVASTEVDRFVMEKLKKLGITPSERCSDEEFLRRASLDVTGTLPAPDEVLAFTQDSAPDKRARKIEELLSRPGYAGQWATFLCDITGNNEDQLRNFLPASVSPANQWYQWLYKRLEQNLPYDQIVEGMVTATSRKPGESYEEYCEAMSEICRDKSGQKYADRPDLVYYWSRNNFRTPEDRAIGFAYSFLGVRIQCAQCHKHPFDQWSKDDFDQFERLFSTVQARQNTMYPDAKKQYQKMISSLGVDKKLKGNQLRREFGKMLADGETVPMPELVVQKPRVRRVKGKPVATPKAKLLGSNWVEMGDEDIRGQLMDWLRDEENPYFTKAIVNRVWAQYMGVGIVNPPDDLNLANAPSNAALLDYLADGFRENGFDLKWLHREILNSDTYQRSWKPNETNAHDKHNFSHAQLRRLSAEATYDAVRMAVARDDLATEARNLERPRALTKAGASARNNRNDDENYALRVFGRSIRESNCDCDRSSEPSLLQTIFLANDSAVHEWLGDSKTSWVAQVSQKFGWQHTGKTGNAAQRKAMEMQLRRMQKQLAEADKRIAIVEEQGRTAQLKALQKRKADLAKRAKAYAKKNGLLGLLDDLPAGGNPRSASQAAMTEEQATWVAQQAYLRTLSRKPSSQELETVTAFLRSEEKPAEAVESLMWSLVNTKEFILNH